ncbi:hypothetical protein QBC38DRAFT_430345 [Podospora fimiseda]|uniref:Uncharacterized protein n=1 Tax=Podospora fimiseda TaxID=252190 RepID=A0AAN6YJY8_9PEZI|nr:hypothetical protein QBC38DRAFT_430345 [Podospora fimiseda]
MLVWTQVQTIATCVGLLAILLTVGTLIHSRYLRLRDSDPLRDVVNPDIMGVFATKRPSYLRVLFGAKVTAPLVPSIGGLIRAGDIGLWTSEAFSHIHTRRCSTTATGWVALAETTLSGMSQLEDSVLRDMEIPADVLAYIREVRKWHGSSHSSTDLYEAESRQLVRCIRQLDREARHATEVPSESKSRLAVCQTEKPWLHRGSLCLSVAASETMALATILGIPLEVNDYTQTIKGIGAFGSSLEIGRQITPPKIELSFPPHWSEPVPSYSSGYTTVMAKNIAFGCVPFSENEYWVNAIYFNDDVLNAIKTGRAITDISGYGGASMQYLWQLPAAKSSSSYFHPRSHWVEDGSRIGAVESMKGDQIYVTWQRAVAGIPFGGIVPQSCSLVAEAVAFSVAGTNLGGCINEIEELINDLYYLVPGTDDDKLTIFGNFVQERCRTRTWIETDNWTRPVRLNTPSAATTFGRYMNLLEIVAARFQSRDGLDRMEILFRKTHECVAAIYKAAVKVYLLKAPQTDAPAWRLTAEEKQVLELDLASALASVRGKLKRTDLLTLEDATVIVRCILAAWAVQVPIIRWKDEMLDSDLGPLSTIPPLPRIRRLAVLGDLPQVAGLG